MSFNLSETPKSLLGFEEINYDYEVDPSNTFVKFFNLSIRERAALKRYEVVNGQEPTFQTKDMERMRHELVFDTMFPGKGTDTVRLGEIMLLSDDSDNKTPDVVEIKGNKLIIRELTTIKQDKDKDSAWQRKVQRYYETCKTRAERLGKELVFEVIVVSRNQYWSNETVLNEQQSSRIKALMNFFVDLDRKINKDKGFDEENKVVLDSILKASGFYEPESEDPLHYDAKLMEWVEELDLDSVKDRATELFSHCLSMAPKRLKSMAEVKERFISIQNNYERSEMNSIVRFPFVSLRPTSRIETKEVNDTFSNSVVMKIFSSLIKKVKIGEPKLDDYDREKLTKEEILQRKTEGTARVIFTEEEKLKLALDGVEAKGRKLENHPLVKLKREIRQSFFNWNTSTTDIDSFLSDFTWFDQSEEIQKVASTPLIISALEDVSGSEETSTKYYNNVNKTHFANALSFIEEISATINLYRRTNQKLGRFSLRKLKSYPVWLAIKCTKKTKPIFYSLLIPKDSVMKMASLPFRQLHEEGDYYYTDFVSSDHFDISHHITAKKFLLIELAHLVHMFDPSTLSYGDFKSERAMRHILYMTLVYLENKRETSADLQQVRYMYMELSSRHNRNPLKPFDGKMATGTRSRLLLWSWHKMIQNFEKMELLKSEEKIPEVGSFTATAGHDVEEEHLISFVDGERINRKIMLNLSYISVLYNKEKSNQDYDNLKIFDKIIAQELELYRTLANSKGYQDMRTGDKFHEDLQYHEFNALFVAHLGDLVMMKTEIHSSDKQAKLISYLGELEWNDVSSTKSSTVFPEVDKVTPQMLEKISLEKIKTNQILKRKSVNKQKRKVAQAFSEINKRRKVMEGVDDLVKTLKMLPDFVDSPKVFANLHNVLKLCKDKEGNRLLASLFKKQQIGGVREIFVLTIVSRITVLFAERVSRWFCLQMPTEMMTKPGRKLSAGREYHDTLLAVEKSMSTEQVSARTISSMTSGDSKTWCQQFVMNVFSTFYTRVFRPSVSANNEKLVSGTENQVLRRAILLVMSHIFNLCTRKRLELPVSVIKLFLKDPEDRIQSRSSEEIRILKKEFLFEADESMGEENHLLPGKHHTQLTNRTNFMQGIFHYTSSLLHAGFQEFFTKISTEQALIWGKQITGSRIHFEISALCSSDDFSYVMSFVTLEIDAKKILKLRHVLTRLSLNLLNLFKLWCARVSEHKTTFDSDEMLEFNSHFTYRFEPLPPTIKFNFAAVGHSKTVTLEGRCQTFANLRQEMVANGSGHVVAAIAQLYQAEAHYDVLGANTNPYFKVLTSKLLQKRHFTLGFFPFEPPVAAGLIGWSIASYAHLQKDRFSRSVHHLFTAVDSLMIDGLYSDYSRIVLSQGNTKSYEAMLKRMGVEPETLKESVRDREKFLKLLLDSSNLDDSLTKLHLSASNSSVAESFQFLDAAEVCVISTYVLTSKCLNYKGEKHSLLWILDHISEEAQDVPFEILRRLYPSAEILESCLMIISKFNRTYTENPKKKLHRQEMSFISKSAEATASLRETVLWRWFNISSPTRSYHSYLSSYSTYSQLYPWLHASFEETITDELFLKIFISVKNFLGFIMRPESKSKQIVVTAPISVLSKPADLVYRSIKFGQIFGLALYDKRTEESLEPHFSSDLYTFVDFAHSIFTRHSFYSHTGLDSEAKESEMMVDYLGDFPIKLNPTLVASLSHKVENKLKLLPSFICLNQKSNTPQHPRLEDVMSLVSFRGSSYFLTYERHKDKYLSSVLLILFGSKPTNYCLVFSQEDKIQLVLTPDTKLLNEEQVQKKILAELTRHGQVFTDTMIMSGREYLRSDLHTIYRKKGSSTTESCCLLESCRENLTMWLSSLKISLKYDTRRGYFLVPHQDGKPTNECVVLKSLVNSVNKRKDLWFELKQDYSKSGGSILAYHPSRSSSIDKETVWRLLNSRFVKEVFQTYQTSASSKDHFVQDVRNSLKTHMNLDCNAEDLSFLKNSRSIHDQAYSFCLSLANYLSRAYSARIVTYQQKREVLMFSGQEITSSMLLSYKKRIMKMDLVDFYFSKIQMSVNSCERLYNLTKTRGETDLKCLALSFEMVFTKKDSELLTAGADKYIRELLRAKTEYLKKGEEKQPLDSSYFNNTDEQDYLTFDLEINLEDVEEVIFTKPETDDDQSIVPFDIENPFEDVFLEFAADSALSSSEVKIRNEVILAQRTVNLWREFENRRDLYIESYNRGAIHEGLETSCQFVRNLKTQFYTGQVTDFNEDM